MGKVRQHRAETFAVILYAKEYVSQAVFASEICGASGNWRNSIRIY